MTIVFFNIATGEIFMVLLVLVLLFGTKQIPQIARGLGKGIRQFKNATSDIQEEITKTAQEVNKQAEMANPLKTNEKSKPKEK